MEYLRLAADGLVALGAGGAGVFLGAFLAYKNERRSKRVDETNRHVSGGRRALFILGCQLNALELYKRRCLDPIRDGSHQWIRLQAVTTRTYEELRQNLDDLSFFLGTDDGQLCFDVLMEDGRFQSAIDAISKRADFHVQVVQPVLARAEAQKLSVNTPDTIELALGPLNSGTLRTQTEQVFSHVDNTIASLTDLNTRLLKALRAKFRGVKWTYMRLPKATTSVAEAAK